ncbi:HIT family protein, partial [Bacillus sp. MHSD17]|nr:HIT family protein [Bacillus sp. MHSD17]
MKHKNVRIWLSRFYVLERGESVMDCLGCKVGGQAVLGRQMYAAT